MGWDCGAGRSRWTCSPGWFDHGQTVPQCDTCDLLVPMMLCPDEVPMKCQHGGQGNDMCCFLQDRLGLLRSMAKEEGRRLDSNVHARMHEQSCECIPPRVAMRAQLVECRVHLLGVLVPGLRLSPPDIASVWAAACWANASTSFSRLTSGLPRAPSGPARFESRSRTRSRACAVLPPAG